MSDYYLLVNGIKSVPFTADKVKEMLSKGKINGNQMVSIDAGGWVRLRELDIFSNIKSIEKKSGFQGRNLNFYTAGCNIILFGLFFVLNFSNFSPEFFQNWFFLLIVGSYSLVLCELILSIAIRNWILILGYLILAIMWISVICVV